MLEAERQERARWVNLRNPEQQYVDTEPTYLPDSVCNGKQMIWVHGYSVDGVAARGWCAEMFKRLYQSGSRAMFTGVAWNGNDGQIDLVLRKPTPDFYINVMHALNTAPALARVAAQLPGRSKCIAGHSLGNMLVSSAIKEHGMRIDSYFMMNAAVAIECYDAAVRAAEMIHPDWANYPNRAYASEWYRLFSAPEIADC